VKTIFIRVGLVAMSNLKTPAMRRQRRNTYNGFSRPETDQITKPGCKATKVSALAAMAGPHDVARFSVSATTRKEPAVRMHATIFGVHTM
jgi:hypothetical protein